MITHWLLSIRMAGQIWRFTTNPIGASVFDGRRFEYYRFDAGLTDPQPTVSVSSVEGVEIPISVLLSQKAWETLAGLQDAGGLTCELALWREGSDWSEREVWGDGRMDRPVFETVGDPLEFSLVEVAWEDRSQIPSPSQQVSAATWPVTAGTKLPDGMTGQFYPYVFGAPGVIYATDTFTECYGWPALLVEIDATTGDNFTGATSAKVLIAGHKTVGQAFTLYNRSTGLSATVTASVEEDLLGQLVTVATVTAGDLQVTEGDELWLSCQDVNSGGIPAQSGETLRGCGGLIRWMIEASTVRFDLSYLPLLSRLDAFKADFFVNTPKSAWGIINDVLISGAGHLLPCYWRRGSGGLYMAVKPWETASMLRAMPRVEINPALLGGSRDGPVTTSSSADLRTDLIALFGRDEQLGGTRRALVYAPVETPGAIVNPYLTIRYASAKVRQKESIDLSAIQDPATVGTLLDILARTVSTTQRSVRYLVPPDDRIKVGGIASVTDSEILWSSVTCWITSVLTTAEGDFWSVDVEELQDWFRTTGGA